MLTVEQARSRIIAALSPVAPEIISLADAAGRVLAQDIAARLTQPPADVSAMDGYALRAADASAGARLRVVGAAPAGRPFDGTLKWGEAVRLFTGSVIPQGADTVLLQEDAAAEPDGVTALLSPKPGQHIRRQGQDFARGDILLHAGHRLGARDIGLAAAANHPWLPVHRRPRIAILATGDEIAMPGEPIGAGGIVSSNSHLLAAMVRAAGADAWLLPVAGDNLAAIAEAAAAAAGADLLVTTGGASVGDHDLVQAGLGQAGFTLDFWKIAMRPGKPMIHGHLATPLGRTPVLGLPGNPVSAFVCATLFLLPAIARLAGAAADPLPTETAILGAPVRANDHRADHLRATLHTGETGEAVVTPYERQDSAMLRLLAEAGALILRPPHDPALPAGASVRIIRLDRLGL
jgi:molybdopterin molybdotransferase